jgi:hypothetical protein
MMASPVTWSVRALGRARRRLLRGWGRVGLPRSRSCPSPGSGEAETVVRGQGRVRALGSGEAEFVVFRGRARVRALGSGEAEFIVFRGRARVRAMGSGEAEFVVFQGRARVRALGSGEAEFVVFRGRARVRALGSGEAEFPMAPEAGLGCCQPHSVEWHSTRSDVGDAVFLSGRLVERRSDCSHFRLYRLKGACRIRCQAILALNAPAIRSVGVAIWPRLLLSEDWASGEPKVCPSLEGVLGRDMNLPGSAALTRGWARARRGRVP